MAGRQALSRRQVDSAAARKQVFEKSLSKIAFAPYGNRFFDLLRTSCDMRFCIGMKRPDLISSAM